MDPSSPQRFGLNHLVSGAILGRHVLLVPMPEVDADDKVSGSLPYT